MIPKKFKLPVQYFPRDTRVVFQNAFFSIKEAPNTVSHHRLGIIIGKWMMESAVGRNAFKRSIFRFFMSKSDFLNSPNGKDLLIVIKPSIMKLTEKELQQALENLYGRII